VDPGTQRGTDAIVIKFAAQTCRNCPVRDQCTHCTDSVPLGAYEFLIDKMLSMRRRLRW